MCWIYILALRTIGLFRLNGNRDEVRKYKILLDEGGAEDFEYPANIDPHTVTSMVKKFLRMLKDPVVPYEMYNDFLKAAGMKQLFVANYI